MTRAETTKFLTEVLIRHRLSDFKYYAKEVTLDWGTSHPKRVDVMQFEPKGTTYPSDIEKGKFTCYEIKSCYEDVYSGNGLNFFGEKNYIVTTMSTYKLLQEDFRTGKFGTFLAENHPESSKHFGVMVAIPSYIDLRDTNQTFSEYENPSILEGEPRQWQMQIISNCQEGIRKRSMSELLFCMLRSKHNCTNS